MVAGPTSQNVLLRPLASACRLRRIGWPGRCRCAHDRNAGGDGVGAQRPLRGV